MAAVQDSKRVVVCYINPFSAMGSLLAEALLNTTKRASASRERHGRLYRVYSV